LMQWAMILTQAHVLPKAMLRPEKNLAKCSLRSLNNGTLIQIKMAPQIAGPFIFLPFWSLNTFRKCNFPSFIFFFQPFHQGVKIFQNSFGANFFTQVILQVYFPILR